MSGETEAMAFARGFHMAMEVSAAGLDAATAMLLIVPGFGSEERAATIDLLRRQASAFRDAGKTFLDDTQRDLKAAHASPNDARGRGLKGEGEH